VLQDDQDAVNRQSIVLSQGVANGPRPLDAKPPCDFLGQVILWKLIEPKRGDAMFRKLGLFDGRYTVQESSGQVIKVRKRPIDAPEHRYRASLAGGAAGQGAVARNAASEGQCGGGSQEFSAGAAKV